MPGEQATILIPDISGYTEFVSKTEIDHSTHILNHLLDTIVESVSEEYVVSEIEGDAVLLYRKGNPPDKKEIVKQCIKTFIDFHNQIQAMNSITLCQCGACKGMVGLTLKFVVHFGLISEIKVSRFVKASGLDMVIAHRLLKNNIDNHEYLLMTRNYLDNIPDADENIELSWDHSTEDYDSIGTVEFRFAPLEAIKKQLTAIPKKSTTVPYDNSKGLETEIGANYKDVFNALINLDWRKYYAAGLKEIEKEDSMTLLGKTHRCVFDDFKVDVEPMNIEVSEKEINYSEYNRVPEMNFYTVFHFTITDLGGNRCKYELHFYPEEGHVLTDNMRAFLFRTQGATISNLKAFAENGFQPLLTADA